MLPNVSADPETEYLATAAALKLRDLARELLSDRDQEVFFAIHFIGYSRKEVRWPVRLDQPAGWPDL